LGCETLLANPAHHFNLAKILFNSALDRHWMLIGFTLDLDWMFKMCKSDKYSNVQMRQMWKYANVAGEIPMNKFQIPKALPGRVFSWRF